MASMQKKHKQYKSSENAIESTFESRQHPVRDAVIRSLGGKYLIPLTSAILITSYSYGLGIDEIKLNSNLGEPLNALVYISSAPGEKIVPSCFSVVNGRSINGKPSIPSIKDATTSMTNLGGGRFALSITTKNSVNEPLSQLAVASNCTSLPRIERSYTIVMEPAPVLAERIANSVYTSTENLAVVTEQSGSQRTTGNRTNRVRAAANPITQGSKYTVRSGDSLSAIAARVVGQPEKSVWSIANTIFTSNPSAFTNSNPNLIEVGSRISIPALDSNFRVDENNAQLALNLDFARQSSSKTNAVVSNTTSSTVNLQAQNSLTNNVTESQNNSPTLNQATFIPVPQAQLVTMTTSLRLSSLSLERIKGRNSGLAIAEEYIPDTSALFPGDENKTPINTPVAAIVNAQVSNNQTTNNLSPEIKTPVAQSSSTNTTSISRWSLLGILASLLTLGLLSWKVLIPYMRRKARIDFIRSVRSHKNKQSYIEKIRQRKEELGINVSNQGFIVSDSEPMQVGEISHGQSNYEVENFASNNSVEIDLNPFADSEIKTALDDALEIDVTDDTTNDFATKRSRGGPRKSNVAEEIYEVGMIDDTGELVSLTTAFPELEAELNARLGNDIPDLGTDLPIDDLIADMNETRQTKTMEFNSDEFGDLQIDPSLIGPESNETMTVKLESPLIDSLDLELPGLMNETINIEADFETIAQDGDLSKTMVFNDEIFTSTEDPLNATTISTELLDADAETRIAPIMTDSDGLTPSDFGLDDDEFPVNREDFSYLEPDASITTEALNLTAEELEELGFGEDDNILPFSPDKRKKSA